MKLGIGSFAYPWAVGVPGFPTLARPMDAWGLLEAAHRLNVFVVQYVDNLPLSALSLDDLDRFVKQANDYQIALEVGMRGTDAAGIRQHLQMAQKVGSPLLRVMIDKAGDTPAPAEVIARLKPLIAEFADAGIRLALENFDRFPAQTFVDLVHALGPDHVGICLDTVNSLGALEGPNVVVQALAPHVINLHVKDVAIRRHPHQLGFVVDGRPAGQGQVDIPGILAQLPQTISVILEQWTPPDSGPIEAVAAREAHGVDESIRYLKTLMSASEVQ